jgi:hypothetical protein
MALYQAKARGRNCACGVLGFPAAAAAAAPLDAIERDLEEAWRRGWVDLAVVPGAAEADLSLQSRA